MLTGESLSPCSTTSHSMGMSSRQERIQKDVDIVIQGCKAEKDCLFSDFRYTDATFTFTYSKGSKRVSYSVHVSEDYPDNTYVSNSENNDDVLVTRDPIPVIFHKIATEASINNDATSCLPFKSKLQNDQNQVHCTFEEDPEADNDYEEFYYSDQVNYDGEIQKHPQLEADLAALRELHGPHVVSLREYGAIGDVDIDLHIDVSFLDEDIADAWGVNRREPVIVRLHCSLTQYLNGPEPTIDVFQASRKVMFGLGRQLKKIMQTFVTRKWKHHCEEKLNCPVLNQPPDKRAKSPLTLFSSLRRSLSYPPLGCGTSKKKLRQEQDGGSKSHDLLCRAEDGCPSRPLEAPDRSVSSEPQAEPALTLSPRRRLFGPRPAAGRADDWPYSGGPGGGLRGPWTEGLDGLGPQGLPGSSFSSGTRPAQPDPCREPVSGPESQRLSLTSGLTGVLAPAPPAPPTSFTPPGPSTPPAPPASFTPPGLPASPASFTPPGPPASPASSTPLALPASSTPPSPPALPAPPAPPAPPTTSNAAKSLPVRDRSFLVQTMEYAVQRIPFLNEYCVVCDEPHVFQNGPMLIPSICERELCVFAFQMLGVMKDATVYIATGAEVVDLLVSLCRSALRSPRKDVIFEPFPSVVDPRDSQKLAFNPKIKNYNRVMNALDNLTSIREMTKGSYLEIKKQMDKQDPLAHPLLQWLISSNRSHIVKLPVTRQLEFMQTPHQFLLLSSPPAKESNFRAAKAIYGSTFAFHGSHIENWHSILRNGLVVPSSSKLQLHGATYGSGIYVSPLSSISLVYSGISKKLQKVAKKDETASNCKTDTNLQSQKKGQQPQFLQSCNLKCIALCEVITSPDLHKHADIWVVANTDNICTRFFFVYEDGQVGGTSVNTQDSSVHSEILRVIGNQTATG